MKCWTLAKWQVYIDRIPNAGNGIEAKLTVASVSTQYVFEFYDRWTQ